MVGKEFDVPFGYEPTLKIYERTDTRTRFWWSYYLPNGIRMRVPASNSRRVAERNGQTKEKQLSRGIFDERDRNKLGNIRKTRLTVTEAVDLYLAVTAKRKSGHTQRNEGYSITSIFKYFSEDRGRAYIDEVTQEDIEFFIDHLLERGKSPNTVNDYLVYIRKLYNKLEEVKRVDENPARSVKPIPVSRSQRARRVYVPIDHLNRIVKAPVPSSTNVALRDIVILMVNTGMRVGEVLHLEWPDIDFQRKLVLIREKPNCATQYGVGWRPKWGAERDVPLNETALWILRKQPRTDTVAYVRGRDEPLSGKFVFPKTVKVGREREGNQQVLLVRCDSVRHHWATLLRRAGLAHDGVLMERFGIAKGSYTLHDLRRTFNTYSIELAQFTQNQASSVTGNDPLVNKEHYTAVVETEIRRKIENLPFDYRETSLPEDPQPASRGRRGHLTLVTGCHRSVTEAEINPEESR